MFLGAMIMGPLSAYVMKRLDALWDGKIKPGFEMLVNNFSAGITGAVMTIGSMFLLGPILRQVIDWLGSAVDTLVDNNLLPLTSILIEPAKVFFLNNAINHGVLTPLGIDQVAEKGKSVLFLLEANPGPGLGILLAYMAFGKGIARASASGRLDHPLLRRHPRDLLPLRADEAEADPCRGRWRHDRRLHQRPLRRRSAGSGSSGLDHRRLHADRERQLSRRHAGGGRLGRGELRGRIAAAQDRQVRRRRRPIGRHRRHGVDEGQEVLGDLLLTGGGAAVSGPISNVVFACDAGMGSSAMGASVLRKKIQAAGYDDVKVIEQVDRQPRPTPTTSS